jgi:hypothetical protein
MGAPRKWVLGAALSAVIGLPQSARAQDAEIVIEWNRILQATVQIPGALPPTIFFPRPFSIMHVAIFDALNSIDYVYTPYATRADVLAGASREAAAAQAARDTLAAMFPNQVAIFDAALAAQLSRIPAHAASDGARVGAAAARAILDLRANDGWNRVPPPYILPDLPGNWQPVPPANAAATLTHYPDVQGFLYANARQFLVEPPPALTSERYATDFNEVKALGGATSTARTPLQTEIARTWAAVGYSTRLEGVWGNLIRDLARSRGLTGLQTARLYALVYMGFHDGLLASMTGKFLYGLWRPTTAIRGADRDGNAATEPDPTFVSLVPTPTYPSYPGNMACVGAVSSQIMAHAFGRNDIPFSVTWAGIAPNPNVTRSYNGFKQLADEEADSRIYAGIHYRFDHFASIGVCTLIGDYAFSNHLRPLFPSQ